MRKGKPTHSLLHWHELDMKFVKIETIDSPHISQFQMLMLLLCAIYLRFR